MFKLFVYALFFLIEIEQATGKELIRFRIKVNSGGDGMAMPNKVSQWDLYGKIIHAHKAQFPKAHEDKD